MTRRLISTLLFSIVLVTLILFIRSALLINRSVSDLNQNMTTIEKKKHIILISPEKNTPYWVVLEEGARQQAEQYGYELQYVGPDRHNIAEVERLLEKAIVSTPDAIITQGLTQYDKWMTKAADYQIPLITVDTDLSESKRLAYVGTDNIKAGTQLAQMIIDHINPPAKVGVIIGDKLSANQLLRLDIVKNKLAAKDIEIVSVGTSNISRLQAAKTTISMLNEHQDIEVMLGLSGLDALGIVDALGTMKRNNISVFGFDNLLNTETFIAENKMIGTVVQQPYEIGAQAIDVLHHYFNQEPYAISSYIATTILTKELLEDHYEN